MDYDKIFTEKVLPAMQAVREAEKSAEGETVLSRLAAKSKTPEGYLEAVKSRLRESGVEVNNVIEDRIIRQMIEDRKPKDFFGKISLAASESPVFNWVQGKGTVKSPLEEYILWSVKSDKDAVLSNKAAIAIYGGMIAACMVLTGPAAMVLLSLDLSSTLARSVYTDSAKEKAVSEWIKPRQDEVTAELERRHDEMTAVPPSMVSRFLPAGIEASTPQQREEAVKKITESFNQYLGTVTAAYDKGEKSVSVDGMETDLVNGLIYTKQMSVLASRIYKQQILEDTKAVPEFAIAQINGGNIKEASKKDLADGLKNASDMAKKYEDAYDKSVFDGVATVSISGKEMSQLEVMRTSAQYSVLASKLQGEINSRKASEGYSEGNGVRSGMPDAPDGYAQQPSRSTLGTIAGADTLQKQSGWLNGAADTLQNAISSAPSFIANLPDTIFGLVRGGNETGMNGKTLIPLAILLFLGMKSNSTLLKIMSFALGIGALGGMLRQGQETPAKAVSENRTESRQQTEGQRFVRYRDEELNAGVTAPEIKGDRLMARFDGVPVTVRLTENQMRAVDQGALPLNTLANAVYERHQALTAAGMQAADAQARQEERHSTLTR